MKLLFTNARLGNVFNALTNAARGYVSPHDTDLSQLMEAAVRFTVELAIEAPVVALRRREGHPNDLESLLIAKLASWVDEDGTVTLRLWTHDMSCVIGALAQAAHRYTHPQPPSTGGVVKYVMETLPRNLTIAAVAFTIQLVLEETDLSAAPMRALEGELIRQLEAPWEFGELPLSVDVQDGPSWEALSAKDS